MGFRPFQEENVFTPNFIGLGHLLQTVMEANLEGDDGRIHLPRQKLSLIGLVCFHPGMFENLVYAIVPQSLLAMSLYHLWLEGSYLVDEINALF